ncbi:MULTISPECIES: mechanosensitive ion channel family protein [Clostridia]|uniref:mechanosensitive ion channel family protein n=1 Tax=Clostridia TaxID=186801 RepID=UPI000EAB52D4|nr:MULTISPECIES: mechanosensitive ion channel family protein [Clostridia]RKQ31104.1 mechanosensitive ion channel family protein [Ruminococcus sp. B05]TAP34606.1 mechanosensitive ion channel family protein [Mediterraneibacter sp. gm002]
MTTTDELQQSAEASVNEVTENMSQFSNYIQEHIPNLINLGIKIIIAIIIFMIGRVIIKWIRKSIRYSFQVKETDAGIATFVDSLVKFGLYILLIIIIAGNLGIELSSITMLFASAGVGVSLALQDFITNFAGGIMILLLRPFTVGDYIIEDTNKNEGTVKEIKIFYTKLMTIENKVIVIPNGKLMNNSLTNVTERDERRLDLKVGISYESDLKKAKEILERLLLSHKDILTNEDWKVFVDSLADSSVVLGIRAYVKMEKYWDTRWELLEQIKLTFDEEGIEIPYNQLTVHMQEKE